jgi:hypothetical protein
MNRKMIYLFSLAGFLLMWGVFGFTATGPRGGPGLQATVPAVENTPVVPAGTDVAGIPITGEPEPVWTEIVVFYGLIGLTAMFLILAMLSLANKSTAPYVEHKGRSSEEGHKN